MCETHKASHGVSGLGTGVAQRLVLRDDASPEIAFKCKECGQSWTVDEDPNEWVYGHDCEAKPQD
jgi:hypothetical protein